LTERELVLNSKRKMSKEEQREFLFQFIEYCKKMEKIYENPRPINLLIDSFLNKLNQNKDE
jgi:hypothetical protein